MKRAWGKYEVLYEDDNCKVKKLIFDVGGATSFQSHEYRAEHWTVIKGTAYATRWIHKTRLKPGNSVKIPQGCQHQLENIGDGPLEVIEVQTGTYFGEDDIVRY